MRDVIIIGGSYAGLAAALQLGRARRDVLIIDAGRRRNHGVAHAHGILGHDGASPAALAALGKAEALAYPTVAWLDGAVSAARAIDGGFAVTSGGDEHRARRLILATGVIDELPDVPGLRERWGTSVFHCPYCDGYERDRGRLGVVGSHPMAGHYAALVAEWGAPGGTTLFLHGGPPPDAAALADLAARGIAVVPDEIAEATDAPGGIELVLRGGARHPLAGVFAMTRMHLAGDLAAQLGCELEDGPTGATYKTDAGKQTTVPGVYACGDAALPAGTVSFAIADGVRAGVFAHQSLVFVKAPA
jgi:thioredoxin reductase